MDKRFWENMMKYFLAFLLCSVISWGFFYHCKLEKVVMAYDAMLYLVSIQVTIAMLAITIMILFLDVVQERILGISYKYIFFKSNIYGMFNITECIFSMLGLMTYSIICTFILAGIDNYQWQRYSRFGLCLSMSGTVVLMLRMVWLGMIAKYKKSRIYELILKKLKKEYGADKQKECDIFAPDTLRNKILIYIICRERMIFSSLGYKEKNDKMEQFKKMELSIYYYIQSALCADTREYKKLIRKIEKYENSYSSLPER